jgi:protein CWC15
MNLQAALGQMPSTPRSDAGTTTTGSFAVKRRWDDDLIFKNQASGVDDKPKKEFVNDILRSEFHRESDPAPSSRENAAADPSLY